MSERLDDMFALAGIERGDLHDALRRMGRRHLKRSLRLSWSPSNPTRNYCYVVSEFVFWYLAPVGSTPYKVEVHGDDAKHWFICWPDGKRVDLTCEQFGDARVNYDIAKRGSFMQSGGKGPSRRARLLAVLLGLKETAWRQR